MFLLFLAADLALKLTPGPDMALTMTRGMTQGFRIAWLSVLGTFAAGFVQVPLIVLGLAAIFRESPALFLAVKLLGALYLVYLGVRALRRSRKARTLDDAAARGEGWDVFVQGFMTNLLNPKVFIFLIAFLPQFTDPAQGPVWLQMLVLACVSKVFGLFSGATYAYGAARIRHWLTRNRWFLQAQEGTLGVIMIAVAGYLAFSQDASAGR
jgi:threonine/homoserine/homoserine lactone efflux protein